MKRILALILAFITIVWAVPANCAQTTESTDVDRISPYQRLFQLHRGRTSDFTDVDRDDWYYGCINYSVGKNYISGVGNDLFEPQRLLTVAETMKFAACLNASYNGKTIKSSKKRDHWAKNYFTYAVNCNIISEDDFDESDYDRTVTKQEMFYMFANALPESEYVVINDLKYAPEKINDENLEKLFLAGIVIGNENGFQYDKSITRAEAACLIMKMRNHFSRVTVNADTYKAFDSQGFVPTKPAHYIFGTKWTHDSLTGQLDIHPVNDTFIKTKYGRHTYLANNQEEYDLICDVIHEAYLNTSTRGGESYYSNQKMFKLGQISYDMMKKMLFKGLTPSSGGWRMIDGKDCSGFKDDEKYVFLRDKVGIHDDTQIVNMMLIEDVVTGMMNYMCDNYADPSREKFGKNSDINDNSIYKWLMQGGIIDCDGRANILMAIYDYLGFSTRAVYISSHAGAQIYLNGMWVCLEDNAFTGRVRSYTAADVKLYVDSAGKEGSGSSLFLGDNSKPEKLKVLWEATHLPQNYDYDAI